jgi:hypothetical protein
VLIVLIETFEKRDQLYYLAPRFLSSFFSLCNRVWGFLKLSGIGIAASVLGLRFFGIEEN